MFRSHTPCVAMPARRAVMLKLLAGIFFCGMAWSTAQAHQPRIVRGGPVTVEKPDISKAYYDELPGTPRTYLITSRIPFQLYLNVLVPARVNPEGRYSAAVYRTGGGARTRIAELAAGQGAWRAFFEPFAHDDYYKGPELREELAPGAYEIEVTGDGNRGKYVLAVGEKESFPPAEIARAVRTVPALKRSFFQSSPAWFAVSLFGGPYLFIMLITGALAGSLFYVSGGKNLPVFRGGRAAPWFSAAVSAGLLALSVLLWHPAVILLAGFFTFSTIALLMRARGRAG